jgi:hypothetical protein
MHGKAMGTSSEGVDQLCGQLGNKCVSIACKWGISEGFKVQGFEAEYEEVTLKTLLFFITFFQVGGLPML